MATTTQSLTVPAREKAEQDCHCGCAPCDGSCCRLDCIVKPRFFCGQLLTDADLSALLKWARDRFGLTRYRHGWGVVCGLDVRCDPRVPTGVIVTPGYAVDCCGDDIIVCENVPIDLKHFCREDEDPCADLRRTYDRLGRGLSEGVPPANPDFDDTPEGRIQKRMRVVDIFLRYDEKPSDPSTAMGRGSCKQVSECEYSRTRESYKLWTELGVRGSDPVSARATKWEEGYKKCVEVLASFRTQFPNLQSVELRGGDVRRWLLRWIDGHPQYQLCHTRASLCLQPDDFFTRERSLVEILFQLIQNCRNAYLNCDCFDCDDDARVPLARVWLLAEDRASNDPCRILTIDPYPPYRRPIQPECWPAPLGSVNVGRFIWHRWDEVCPALDDLGLHVEPREFQLPATVPALIEALQCDLFVKCGERRVALVYDANFLGRRVVGFCTDTGPAPQTPSLTVQKTSSADLTGAKPGDEVTYNFVVRNTGDVDFVNVRLQDSQLSMDRNIGPLAKGAASQSHTHSFRVPAGAVKSFRNEVTATGITADEKTATNRASHDLKIKPTAPATKFDSYGAIRLDDEKARLDNFAVQLNNEPAAQGHIIVYAETIEATKRANRAKEYLVTTRGIVASRVVTKAGSTRPDIMTELWIVPPGAPEPEANVAAVGGGSAVRDNLTNIAMIGPSRAKTLYEAGIERFADIAASPLERLRGLFPAIKEDILKEWIEEAKKRLG